MNRLFYSLFFSILSRSFAFTSFATSISSCFIIRGVFCIKMVAILTVGFSKVFCGNVIALLVKNILGGSNHSKVVGVATRSIFTDMVGDKALFISPQKHQHKLVRTDMFAVVGCLTVTIFISCALPLPATFFSLLEVFNKFPVIVDIIPMVHFCCLPRDIGGVKKFMDCQMQVESNSIGTGGIDAKYKWILDLGRDSGQG